METRTNIFKRDYKGPKGKHLNCLTETTRFGDYKPENQKSIHANGRRKKRSNRVAMEGQANG